MAVESILELAFIDSSGSVISTSQTGPITQSSYRHAFGDVTVPANTVEIEVRLVREGADTGEAFGKKVQVNPGTRPCSHQEPGEGPCANLMGVDAAAEYSSDAADTSEHLVRRYQEVDLAAEGLEGGDWIALAFEGKVSDATVDAQASLEWTIYGDQTEKSNSLKIDTASYVRREWAIQTQSDANAIRLELWKRGSGSAKAFGKEVHLNLGRVPCEFEEPDLSGGGGGEDIYDLTGDAILPEGDLVRVRAGNQRRV